MARTPSIADLLDDVSKPSPLKLDRYLASLEPGVRDRVVEHLQSSMSSRRIALTISNDPSTEFSISPSAIDKWRQNNSNEAPAS